MATTMAKSKKPKERQLPVVLKPAPDEIFAHCDLVKDRQDKGLRLLDESHSRQRELSKEYRLLDDEYWEITRKIDDEFYAGRRKWGHEDALSRRLDTICDRQEAIKAARKNYWNRDFYIHNIVSEYTNRLFKSLDGPQTK